MLRARRIAWRSTSARSRQECLPHQEGNVRPTKSGMSAPPRGKCLTHRFTDPTIRDRSVLEKIARDGTVVGVPEALPVGFADGSGDVDFEGAGDAKQVAFVADETDGVAG